MITQEKKASLTSQYEKLTADGSRTAAVSDEEWRQKYESMKAALPQYKKMKKELGDIEVGALALAQHQAVKQGRGLICKYCKVTILFPHYLTRLPWCSSQST